MNSQKFEDFINSALNKLCRFIDVKEGILLFKFGKKPTDAVYIRKADTSRYIGGGNEPQNTAFVYVDAKAPDPVLCRAVDEVCDFLEKEPIDLSREQDWLYNFNAMCYYTPETLALLLRDRICDFVFKQYYIASGIDSSCLTKISETYYESESAKGLISFIYEQPNSSKGSPDSSMKSPDDSKKVELVCGLEEKNAVEFRTENAKYIRKLLAGAGDNALLFTRFGSPDDGDYRCKGYVNPNYDDAQTGFDISATPDYTIVIERQGTWTFYSGGKKIFRVRSGNILSARNELDDYIAELYDEVGAESSDFDKLKKAVRKLSAQSHGTSAVFLDLSEGIISKRKMKRLAKNGRAVRVSGDQSTIANSLCSLSRMDGALVFNYKTGDLEYINVILDGISKTAGDRSSGARHNAVSCFIDNLAVHEDVTAAAIVFSESGDCSVLTTSKAKKRLPSSRSRLKKTRKGTGVKNAQ